MNLAQMATSLIAGAVGAGRFVAPIAFMGPTAYLPRGAGAMDFVTSATSIYMHGILDLFLSATASITIDNIGRGLVGDPSNGFVEDWSRGLFLAL